MLTCPSQENPQMLDKPTTRLRELMQALRMAETEHARQRYSPTRGYDENRALDQILGIRLTINSELDAIDEKHGISEDISDRRRMLSRWLLTPALDDEEAIHAVANHPAIREVHAQERTDA